MRYYSGTTNRIKWWYLLLAAVFSLNAGDTLPKSFGFTTLKPSGIDSYEATILSQLLRKEVEKTGIYSTLEFSDITIRLTEQNIPNTCFDVCCAVAAGQILGVDFFGFGTIGKVGKAYTLSMQVVEVRSGRIIQDSSEFFKGKKADFEQKVIPLFAKRISGIKVEEKSRRR
jgi:hypothetical protein